MDTDEPTIEEKEYLDSLVNTKEGKQENREETEENVDSLISARYEQDIKQRDEQIAKLSRRNALLEKEYKRLYHQTTTGITFENNNKNASLNVEDIIKDTMRGRYYGNN